MLRHAFAAATVAAVSTGASAVSVTLLTQERTVTARTSFDANVVTASAPNFQPFATTVTASVNFPASGGGTGANSATTTINCLANPNKILSSGTLAGSGGTAQVGAMEQDVLGECKTSLLVNFNVTTPTPYRLTATPRPSDDPVDSFEIKLRNEDAHDTLAEVDQTMPAQGIATNGVLAPGHYSIRYTVEFTVRAGSSTAPYNFLLDLAPGCNQADVAGLGGAGGGDNQLTSDDLLVFLTAFFAGDLSIADLTSIGGASIPDGQLTADDVVGFLSAFFAGCG